LDRSSPDHPSHDRHRDRQLHRKPERFLAQLAAVAMMNGTSHLHPLNRLNQRHRPSQQNFQSVPSPGPRSLRRLTHRNGHDRLGPTSNATHRQTRPNHRSAEPDHRDARRQLPLHDLLYSSIPHDHGNRPTGDPLPAPEGTQTFCTATLHGHRRTCSLRKTQLHLVTPWCQLRRLGNDGAVDIADAPPIRPHECSDMAKHGQGVCPLPLRISVRKMLADIPEARGPEQRIGDCMGRSICVAVPMQTDNALKDTATEHHRA
jgi:hypothetical protein